WSAAETAVVVCDMWDLHHCLNATRRVGEMAPRMNQVLKAARSSGALIIHAPSSCMDPYKDHPGRLRAMNAPRADNVPEDIGQWCYKIPQEDGGKYPIDQSDGGEDDDLVEHAQWARMLTSMDRNPRAPWKSQTDLLEIHDEDLISDNGVEIWNVMEQRGIKNVILVGVHTNMCVLGRPFGLRQMAKNGKNVVLMRDMTDTMYNPKMEPHVSHFTGTDLIVEHIEKWVCPTITSDQVIGGSPFQFDKDRRRHLVIIMGEREYRTNESLPAFALEHLGQDFRVSYVHASAENRDLIPGIEALREADVALISVRRRAIPEAHLQLVRDFIQSGKPVVGIRTASHAFSLNGKPTPEGHAVWESFDADVWGGHYTGHHGSGPRVQLASPAEMASHPIMVGVDVSQLKGCGSLYKTNPLSTSTTALITGTIPDTPRESIAWTNVTRWGGRAFYTSLGHVDDFQQPAMNQLLKNAIYWAADLPVKATVATAH
ncbi:MAG: ThuA domain-containing protein, partial [Planctomycetota bacterium]|nr:ThuA domain-containing protein [Planctomycetota bacterium]